MSHTPGPWAVDTVVSDEPEFDIILGRDIPGAGSPVLVASVYADDDMPGIDQAAARSNARLIATAPELLAAAEAVLPTVPHAEGCRVNGNRLVTRLRGDQAPVCDCPRAALAAAISKAKGAEG